MSEINIKKRDRGANYTEEERTLLAELVMQYKHIVEDKRTAGIIIRKKQEAWKAITAKYNRNCSSGPRNAEQLRTKYDNMKQIARKTFGESKKIDFVKDTKITEEPPEEDLSHTLNNVRKEKIQIKNHGGTQKMTESDAIIMGIIQEQVDPFSNALDSEPVNIVNIKEDCDNESICNDDDHTIGYPDISLQEMDAEETPDLDPCNVTAKNDFEHKIDIKTRKYTPPPPKITKRNMSADALKRIYFRTKCQNAVLEQRKLKMELQHLEQKHKLELMLLKKKFYSTP